MKELTKEKLAEMLDGRDITREYDIPTWRDVQGAHLVVLFGHSDDLIEVRGAVHDEIDSYEGSQFALILAGEKIDDGENSIIVETPSVLPLSEDYDQSNNPRLITARYGSVENAVADWEFETAMPHATFMLFLKGRPFCKGIVIDLDEISPITENAE